MKEIVASQLIDINRQFYQTFALRFSEKRTRLQPGIARWLPGIPSYAKILDLGCGNGEFACALARQGHQGEYTGLDFSQELLEEAQSALQACLQGKQIDHYKLHRIDLSSPDWEAAFEPASFDLISAFALLHHLPGESLRRQVVQSVHRLLLPHGRFMHSVWQFLNSPRLAARVQPWEKAGLSAEQVDPGDYLLDWRHGGSGLRYVHLFTAEELAALANETGFKVLETFHSDGEAGRLGLYQVWTPL